MPLHSTITSTNNQNVKNVVKMRERKTRNETGLTLIEGCREVVRAADAGIRFEELFICPQLLQDRVDGESLKRVSRVSAAVFEVTPPVFAKIAFGDRHEGILAICRQPAVDLKDMLLKARPFFIVVEHVEKPGNLGAVIRTCDAAGVDGLIVCDAATDVYNPQVIRASIGTVFSVKTAVSTNETAYTFFKDNAISVCVATPDAALVYTGADFTGPAVLVLGSEQAGVSDFWLTRAVTRVKIPMNGTADSLNVSVTAAVIIFEAVRQRTVPPCPPPQTIPD